MWQSIYLFLDQLGTIVEVTGSIIGLGAWIKNKFNHKYTPNQFVQFVTSKELWNTHELAIKLSVSDKEAKDLLKGFGYKWNKEFSLYIKTDRTVEIMENIEKSINQY